MTIAALNSELWCPLGGLERDLMSVVASAFNTDLKQAFKWDFVYGLTAFRAEVSGNSKIVHSAVVYSEKSFIVVGLYLRTYGISS